MIPIVDGVLESVPKAMKNGTQFEIMRKIVTIQTAVLRLARRLSRVLEICEDMLSFNL